MVIEKQIVHIFEQPSLTIRDNGRNVIVLWDFSGFSVVGIVLVLWDL